MRFDSAFTIPEVETSGDGDAAPAFESSNWMYLSGTFHGLMIAASVSTFVLANLIDAAKNPLAASMKVNFATQQILTIPKVLITGFYPNYERKGAIIPVSMRIRATDSHPVWGTT